MNIKNNKFSNKKGFALPMVLLVVVVLSILFSSLIIMTQANTKHVTLQEDNLRAYYLARSGIDIAYTALMEDNEKKFKDFLNDNDELLHDNLALPDDIETVGHVDVVVTKPDGEVKIHAKARTESGNGTSKLSLYIDITNINRIRWVKE